MWWRRRCLRRSKLGEEIEEVKLVVVGPAFGLPWKGGGSFSWHVWWPLEGTLRNTARSSGVVGEARKV
jgi:hypothetical protein